MHLSYPSRSAVVIDSCPVVGSMYWRNAAQLDNFIGHKNMSNVALSANGGRKRYSTCKGGRKFEIELRKFARAPLHQPRAKLSGHRLAGSWKCHSVEARWPQLEWSVSLEEQRLAKASERDLANALGHRRSNRLCGSQQLKYTGRRLLGHWLTLGRLC